MKQNLATQRTLKALRNDGMLYDIDLADETFHAHIEKGETWQEA